MQIFRLNLQKMFVQKCKILLWNKFWKTLHERERIIMLVNWNLNIEKMSFFLSHAICNSYQNSRRFLWKYWDIRRPKAAKSIFLYRHGSIAGCRAYRRKTKALLINLFIFFPFTLFLYRALLSFSIPFLFLSTFQILLFFFFLYLFCIFWQFFSFFSCFFLFTFLFLSTHPTSFTSSFPSNSQIEKGRSIRTLTPIVIALSWSTSPTPYHHLW